MTPTSSSKKGVRYRYYMSAALLNGRADEAGSMTRVPAELIETLVVDALRKHLVTGDTADVSNNLSRRHSRPIPHRKTMTLETIADRPVAKNQRLHANDGAHCVSTPRSPSSANAASDPPKRACAGADPRLLVQAHVARVEVGPRLLKVVLKNPNRAPPADAPARTGAEFNAADEIDPRKDKPTILSVPWTKPPSKVARDIIPPAGSVQPSDKRPIRAETRAKLITAIARGRQWVDDLVDGRATSIEDFAEREGCSPRQVNMTISLAFLSPRLVTAAVDGRLPRGIGVSSLRDLPPIWADQHRKLGLAF